MSRTLEILDRLIAFPTVSSESNLALIDYVQDLLAAAGFKLTRIPSPCGQKAGLFAQIGPGTDGGVCLSAHTDVVPIEGQDWARPAFQMTQNGDRVFGRGVTDMKGFLASALAIAENTGQGPLAAPLSLSISYDEEVGCVGIRQMIPTLAPLLGRPRAVIVGEPTGMQVAVGHKGKAALRVTCTGQAGHSALAPNFTNAIHLASDFVREIRALQSELVKAEQDVGYVIPYSTLHVGRIAGGRALNIVPDQVVLEMEYRHLPQIAGARFEGLIRDTAARVAVRYSDGDVSVEVVNAYPGLDLAPDADAIGMVQSTVGNADTTKVAFGTEAGFFADLGLEAVVCGPGDMARDGHKPDEGLDVAQLAACDAMMASLLAGLREA